MLVGDRLGLLQHVVQGRRAASASFSVVQRAELLERRRELDRRRSADELRTCLREVGLKEVRHLEDLLLPEDLLLDQDLLGLVIFCSDWMNWKKASAVSFWPTKFRTEVCFVGSTWPSATAPWNF
jgi:hypothetical protein